MLFDLRGRGRRRTVQVVYIGLAAVFLLGFVGFGVGGGFGSGGIFDVFTKNEGSGGVSHSGEVKKFEKLTRVQPNNVSAWEKLVNAQLHEAGGEAYITLAGGVTSKGKQLYSQIDQAWTRYIALNPPKPNVALAKNVLRIYGEEGLNRPASAVQVLQLILAAEPNSAVYYRFLAEYAYKAKNTRIGDLAAAKAVSLAPPEQRKRLKTELAALKKGGGSQTLTGTTNGKTYTVNPAGKGTYTGTLPPSTSPPGSTTSK
jgi:hypothetical protein